MMTLRFEALTARTTHQRFYQHALRKIIDSQRCDERLTK